MAAEQYIGHKLPTTRATVEPGRLRAFRRTVGCADEKEPLAPLTYLFALEMLEAEKPLAFILDLGIDLGKVLHSEQAFEYFHPIHAGDVLVMESEVTDSFDKKGGALTFIVQKMRVTREGDGMNVANFTRTLVVQNG